MVGIVSLVSIDYLLFNSHKDDILVHMCELRHHRLDLVSLFHDLFLVFLDDRFWVVKELFWTHLFDIVRVWIFCGIILFEQLENF